MICQCVLLRWSYKINHFFFVLPQSMSMQQRLKKVEFHCTLQASQSKALLIIYIIKTSNQRRIRMSLSRSQVSPFSKRRPEMEEQPGPPFSQIKRGSSSGFLSDLMKQQNNCTSSSSPTPMYLHSPRNANLLRLSPKLKRDKKKKKQTRFRAQREEGLQNQEET